MESISFKNSKIQYILILFIILWSGGGFTYGYFKYWPYFLVLFLSIVAFRNNAKITKKEICVFSFIYSFLLFQNLYYGSSFTGTFLPFSSILAMFLCVKLYSKKFTDIFISIVYHIALVTLVIWILCLIPSIKNAIMQLANRLPDLGFDNILEIRGFTKTMETIYIYTFDLASEKNRNFGPFWEPGRYTIYLNIALALNLFKNNTPLKNKKNLILIFTNITTFSTTGYLVLFMILLAYSLNEKMSFLQKALLFLTFAILTVYVLQLDFMTEKINNNMASDSTESRFTAMAYHFMQIQEHPYLGYGINLSSVFNELEGSPNGLTDLMRYWGVPLSLILYFLFIFKGNLLEKNSIYNRLLSIIILVLAFSQTITMSPFYYFLYIKALDYEPQDKKNSNSMSI